MTLDVIVRSYESFEVIAVERMTLLSHVVERFGSIGKLTV